VVPSSTPLTQDSIIFKLSTSGPVLEISIKHLSPSEFLVMNRNVEEHVVLDVLKPSFIVFEIRDLIGISWSAD